MNGVNQVNDEVRQFVLGVLNEMGYEATETDGNTPMGPAGLALESLAVAELSIFVEDPYHVRFGDDEMETLALMTISQLVDEIVVRMEAAKAGSTSE